MIIIDPGQSGGIVTVNHYLRSAPEAFSMPATDGDILEKLSPPKAWAWDDKVAYLEELVKYTGRNMPSSSMAVYASNWGMIKGMLLAYQYKVILVPPKKWQKVLGLGSATGMSKTEWKNKLKQMAQQLYPQLKITLATADALLIYEAAKRGGLG